MKLALFGASGTLGQRILREALSRGHTVSAIVRDPSRITEGCNRSHAKDYAAFLGLLFPFPS